MSMKASTESHRFTAIVNGLKERLSAKEQECDEWKKRYNYATERNVDLRAENERLKSMKESWEKTADDRKAQIQLKDRVAGELNLTFVQQDNEIKSLRKRCEDLEAENKKLAESEQYYEGLVIAFSNDRDSLIKERDGIIEAMDSNRLTHNNDIQYLREYFNDLNKLLKRMPPERVPFDLLKIMNDGEFIFKVSQ